MPRPKQSDFWPCLALFALTSALLLPIALAGRTTLMPLYEDLTQWPLYRYFIKESLLRGYFPLWCDGLYSGFDFAGWGHASAFYPLAFFFFVFKYPVAMDLNEWLHLLIGIYGFYFMARTFGLQKEGALISALGYGFTYLFTSMITGYLPHTFVIVYIPWVFGLSYRLIQKPTASTFLLLALPLSLQVLSGHYEIFAMQNLGVIFFLATLVLLERNRRAVRVRGMVLLAFAFAWCALLASGSLLASSSAYGQSYRSLGFSYEYFAKNIQMVGVGVMIPWMMATFSPVFALFLITGLKKIKNPIFLALMVVMVFSLVSAFDWFNYFRVIYHIPVLNKWPPAGVSLHILVPGLFLIFGAGIDVFPKTSSNRTLRLTLIFLALEVIFAYTTFALIVPPMRAVPEQFAGLVANFLRSRKIILFSMAVGAAIFIILLLVSRNQALKGRTPLLAIILLDFLVTGFVLAPRNAASVLDPPPEYERFLSNIAPGAFRIQSIHPADLWYQLKIPIQTGVLFNTRAPDAFIFFSTLRYTEFLNLLEPKTIVLKQGKVADVRAPYVLRKGDFISRENLPLINLLNLKYFEGLDKNIKNADYYNIAYEAYRFKPSQGVEQSASFQSLKLRPLSSFGLLLYVSPGDRLRLQPAGKGTASLDFRLSFADQSGATTLVYKGAFNFAQGLEVDLQPLATKTGTLLFSFLPLNGNTGDFEITATIENPAKFFKHLPYRGIDIFENPAALPRSFLVHGVKVIPEKEKRLAYLKSADFDPAQTAVVEKAPVFNFPEKYGAAPGESVTFDQSGSFSGSIRLGVINRGPAILVLSESYYPGWRAWIDHAEQKIFPVDHAFKGVLLPERGMHEVVLEFAPASFELALWTAMVSGLCWLGFALTVLLRRGRAAAG